MLRVMAWIGVVLLLAGGVMVGASFVLQPPPRDSLPVASGTVVATWRYVQRSGTDYRIQIAAPGAEPRTVWLPIAQATPAVIGGIQGRAVTVRHATNGEVLEMVVNGRPVIDYAISSGKRLGGLVNNRWIGFGLFMAGLTLASIGFVFRH